MTIITKLDWSKAMYPDNSNIIDNNFTNLDNTINSLNKTDVWLDNVDNTADADKPISTSTQNALDSKEDSFTKNTAFNKDFWTSAWTILEWNTNVWKVWTKTVNETNIADTKMLAYSSVNDNLEYIDQPSGWWGGWYRSEVYIVWPVEDQTILFEWIVEATTLSKGLLSFGVAPAWADFIVSVAKSVDEGNTYGTAETITVADWTQDKVTTLSWAYTEGDYMKVWVSQNGSTTKGADLNLIIKGS